MGLAISTSEPQILVMGGGGSRENNEISLEKNVLYFQRTLKALGYKPAIATYFFANGTDGQASIYYYDSQKQEKFKAPEIPYLKGASTPENLIGWLQSVKRDRANRPVFFYFTGHGGHNKDYENNHFYVWNNRQVSVQQLTNMLDQLPPKVPVTTVMAQCYAGSFANIIYENGDPTRAISSHRRCGFFATIKKLTSVGCTPEVDEADYEDYSSSFFAGLSGVRRTGEKIPLPDYNRDKRVSYAEAHAFAKLDDHSSDLPVSTLEVWLQKQVSEAQEEEILNRPLNQLLQSARPERFSVVTALALQFNFNLGRSFNENYRQLSDAATDNEQKEAYLTRLSMELVNIAAEQKIKANNDTWETTVLDRLIDCESSSLSQS